MIDHVVTSSIANVILVDGVTKQLQVNLPILNAQLTQNDPSTTLTVTYEAIYDGEQIYSKTIDLVFIDGCAIDDPSGGVPFNFTATETLEWNKHQTY